MLSKLNSDVSTNFVTPSTLNLHSWMVMLGLATEIQSISPILKFKNLKVYPLLAHFRK